MIDWIWSFLWGAIPTWVWIVIGGVAVGAAWRTFGWQGVVGGLLALLTLGAYRQGWQDRDASKPPLVPVEDYEQEVVGDVPRKRRRTLMDIMNGK